MSFLYVKIPWEMEKPLESLVLELENEEDISAGDCVPKYLKSITDSPDQNVVETTPLKRMAPVSHVIQNYFNATNLAGVYVHHISSTSTTSTCTVKRGDQKKANLRATCLSMACGLHSNRFYGDVYVSRLGYFVVDDEIKLMNSSIAFQEIEVACITPDLRQDIVSTLMKDMGLLPSTGTKNVNDAGIIELPGWLTEASKNNYEDSAALSVLASVMKRDNNSTNEQSSTSLPFGDVVQTTGGDEDEGGDDEESAGSENESQGGSQSGEEETKCVFASNEKAGGGTFITRVPLCLHCRRPSDALCPNCNGAYFCLSPKPCKDLGWSHQCSCRTWKIYTERREVLGSFPFFTNWLDYVISRECQISDKPYRDFLMNNLGVLSDNDYDEKVNWWNTEGDGWSGGGSKSAKNINVLRRLSYQEGFDLKEGFIPPERPVTKEDCERSNISSASSPCKLLVMKSWEDYYNLRQISMESPVALLLTFPLTIYFALMKFGDVPITVAKMLNRAVRVHVVGVEKELNFLDMFKEVAFLLPEGLEVELVFIVRDDMLPESCKGALHNGKQGLDLQLTPTFNLIVQSGSYNLDMDPQFDCGSGPPDMLIGMNAGLFAYESWRSVVEYLDVHRGVVGCFTDYNEHSGVNCASLGGGKVRESLMINPFRQPHSMPVYSMNLPQFSNGFMYVFNEQELE